MFSQLKKLTSSQYFSLSLVFVVANFTANILNYLFHFFASRTYGPAVYGEIVSLFSHLYILGVPSLIFATFVVKYIGQGRSPQAQFQRFSRLYHLLDFKSPKFLLPLVLISSAFFFLGRFDNLSPTSSLTLAILFFLSLFTTYLASFLRAFKAFFVLALGLLLATGFKFLGSLLAYFFHFTSLKPLWSFLLLGIIIQIYLLFHYFSHHLLAKANASPTSFSARQIYQKLFSPQYLLMIIALLSVTAVVNLDVIFVRKTLSPQLSGLYGAWSMLAKIIMYAGGPISTVAFVFFADNHHSQNKKKLLLFSSLINLLAGLVLLVIYTFFGQLIVTTLFGPSFIGIASHLTQAALFGLLYSLIANLNNYFIAQDSPASLLTLGYLVLQILLFFLFGHSFANIINIQLFLAFLTLSCQLIYLSYPNLSKN